MRDLSLLLFGFIIGGAIVLHGNTEFQYLTGMLVREVYNAASDAVFQRMILVTGFIGVGLYILRDVLS